VLTTSEPLISEGNNFLRIKERHNIINEDNVSLLSKLKDLPRELQIKILDKPFDFNDYQCGHPHVEDGLTDYQTSELLNDGQSTDKTNFLFPISIRKRINQLHSTTTETYIIVRAASNREPFNEIGKFSGSAFTTNESREKNGSIRFISKDHFDGQIYNMNNEILRMSAICIDQLAPIYHDGSHVGERDNPFFRKDDKFVEIKMICKCRI
jgi:hypothetical protein